MLQGTGRWRCSGDDERFAMRRMVHRCREQVSRRTDETSNENEADESDPMTTAAPAMEAIIKRLEVMERLHRKLLVVGASGLVLGALASVLASVVLLAQRHGREAAPSRSPNVVEAERFVLRDAQGVVHGELALDDRGAGALRIFDREGRYHAHLRASGVSFADSSGGQRAGLQLVPGARASEAPAAVLHLADANGKSRGSLAVLADGSSRFLLSDAEGKGGASLQSDAGGTARIALSDPSGRSVAWLGALPDGSRAFVIDGAKGASVTISTGPNGVSEVLLRDGAGKERAALAVLSDGMPFFRLSGEDSQSGASLGVTAGGATVLELIDEGGKAGATLATASGSSGLILRNLEGKEVAGLTTTAGRWPRLALSGDGRNVGTMLSVSPDGAPALTLHDGRGRPRAVLGQVTVGEPPSPRSREGEAVPFSLTFVGDEGKIVKQLPP